MSVLGRTAGLALLALLAGCNFAPKYTRPSTPTAPGDAWKELTPADAASTDGWKRAQPSDGMLRGSWWEMFDDPLLNDLERQLDEANQSVALAVANYRAARAVVAQYRSQLFPLLTAQVSASRSGPPGRNQFQVPVGTLSWEPDLWGSVENSVAASADEAQATAADLENTRLSLHAQLGVYYFSLRGQDSAKQLLDDTVTAYQRMLDLTKVRHEQGVASDQDVAQAETQLKQTIAQATDLGISRAQYEHAIAVLVGKSASSFSIPPAPLRGNPPPIPIGLPSQLLERRPDIAAAERRVAEANAQIGVAKAAFFPSLNLSASGGLAGNSLSTLFSAPTWIWSFGASLGTTLFDAGKRQAQVEQADATYQGYVASYRQTVLTAFQNVEDQLASLRILSQERGEQDDAVRAAQRYLSLAQDRYQYGVDSYLNVITAQTTLLSNQRTALTLRIEQMTASVQLVQALGGGWNVTQLAAE